MNVVVIIELEELLLGELRAIVHDNGVWHSKAMDDVKEEQHGLLGLDRRDRLSLYPLCKLVYGDKQVCVAPEHPLEGFDQIEPLDYERPHDGDRLECLGRQVGLLSVVRVLFRRPPP